MEKTKVTLKRAKFPAFIESTYLDGPQFDGMPQCGHCGGPAGILFLGGDNGCTRAAHRNHITVTAGFQAGAKSKPWSRH